MTNTKLPFNNFKIIKVNNNIIKISGTINNNKYLLKKLFKVYFNLKIISIESIILKSNKIIKIKYENI